MGNMGMAFGLIVMAVAMTGLMTNDAFGELLTPSGVSVVSVVGTTLTYTCTDATYGTGETLAITDVDIVETATVLTPIACDGSNQVHDISALTDLTIFTLRVTSVGDFMGGNPAVGASIVTTPFTTLDFTKPVIAPNGVTATVELELVNSYTELNAVVTDNDPLYTTPNLVVGGDTVDTSVIGIYVVTYNADADLAGNTPLEASITITVEDTTAPTLTLVGIDPETVQITEAYVDEGATISDNDKFVNGDPVGCDAILVNVFLVGSYTVFCDFADLSGNNAPQITRTVNVVDNVIPIITLVGDNPQTVFITQAYTELGAEASDINDGDITGSIIIDASAVDVDTFGSYPVTYNVADSSGNNAEQVIRTVNVEDNIAPVITLIGDPVVEVPFGSIYVDEGATALDVNDGDITADIITVNFVNTFIPNTTFFITYNVVDESGNNAIEVIRQVNIGAFLGTGIVTEGDTIHCEMEGILDEDIFFGEGFCEVELFNQFDEVFIEATGTLTDVFEGEEECLVGTVSWTLEFFDSEGGLILDGSTLKINELSTICFEDQNENPVIVFFGITNITGGSGTFSGVCRGDGESLEVLFEGEGTFFFSILWQNLEFCNGGGDSCHNCQQPSIGVTERGHRVVNGGLTVNGQTTNADFFFTAFPLIQSDIGQPIDFVFKIWDDRLDNIQHLQVQLGKGKIGESFSVDASATYDRNKMSGIVTVTHDPMFTNVIMEQLADQPCKVGGNDCTVIHVSLTPTEPIVGDVVFGVNIWDEARNAVTSFFNEGLQVGTEADVIVIDDTTPKVIKKQLRTDDGFGNIDKRYSEAFAMKAEWNMKQINQIVVDYGY